MSPQINKKDIYDVLDKISDIIIATDKSADAIKEEMNKLRKEFFSLKDIADGVGKRGIADSINDGV
jgi:predicted DNA-binding ArsR family transcriptional regulator